MFGHSELRKRFLMMMIPWFAVGMSAYGIHFAVKSVEINMFLASGIKEIVIIVCILIATAVYNKVKIKSTNSRYILF